MVPIVVDVRPKNALGFVWVVRQVQVVWSKTYTIAQIELQFALMVGNTQIIQSVAVEVRHTQTDAQVTTRMIRPNVHLITHVHKRSLGCTGQRCEHTE